MLACKLLGGIAQLARASALQAEGQGFESLCLHIQNFIRKESGVPSGKKRKRKKIATHKRKKRLRKNRHKKKK